MTGSIDERCFQAAVNLFNGKAVVIRASVVRSVGLSALVQTIKDWLHYECMAERYELPGEPVPVFRLWAEMLPGGSARVHAKRVA